MSNTTIWIIIGGVIAFALILCFLLAVANFAGDRFDEKYEKINSIEAETQLSPLQYIYYLEKKYFKNFNLEVIQISRIAGDAYGGGKLFLSTNTLSLKTLASYTVISHELGHALQDSSGNKIKRLNFLRRFGRIVGRIFMPSLIAGLILLAFGDIKFYIGLALIGVGVLILILSLVVKLMTISIEKDASRKAMVFLKEIFDEKQLKICKKFLKSAALTYWAEFLKIILFWTGASKRGRLFN